MCVTFGLDASSRSGVSSMRGGSIRSVDGGVMRGGIVVVVVVGGGAWRTGE